MSRRFPWANANRIADDHRLEVEQISAAAGGKYRRADFTGGPCYLPPDAIPTPEALSTKRMIVTTICWLGAWGALGFALTWLLGAL